MSVLYYLTKQSLALTPIHVPNKIKVKELSVAVEREHAIIISQECMVFTYGRGTEGQLGHGYDKSRQTPVLVQALKSKSVNRACCGDGFSVFASNNGIVMTCGDAASGCLGHNEEQSLNKPKLIEALLHVDVVSIACGTEQVAIVGNSGDVYTWGNGAYGKLRLGSEDNASLPQKVAFYEPVKVKEVFCSETGTMFLTDVGSVWACGSNKNNRLGLNNRQGFFAALKKAFSKAEVEGSKEPAVVCDLCRFIVTSISMGAQHTAVLNEGGQVITFGRNSEAQPGSGDCKPQQGLVNVKSLLQVNIGCTPLSTVVSISNGQLLFLGSRYKQAPSTDSRNWLDPSSVKRELSNEAVRSRQGSASSQRSLSRSSILSALKESQGLDHLGSHSGGRIVSVERQNLELDCKSEASSLGHRQLGSAGANSVRAASSRELLLIDQLDTQFQPTPLMNIQSEQSETATLSCFTCHGKNLIVLVETTAPPAQKILKKRRSNQKSLGSQTNLRSSASSREALEDSELSEMDTTSTVPTWLKGELAEAPVVGKDAQPLDDAKMVISKPPMSPTKAIRETPSGKATVFHKKRPKDYSGSSSKEDDTSQPISTAWTADSPTAPLPSPDISHGVPTASKGVRRLEGTKVSERPDSRVVLENDLLKKEAELRISKLEEAYSQRADEANEKSVQAAMKEEKLEKEIRQLRDELAEQSSKCKRR
ncbi:uncharacterized protein [Watersipora subatra]|uniref:uncharacterized protein n=1 Tax=Watersipora subatra TaxID=2589382 RepID=UPI00355C28F9